MADRFIVEIFPKDIREKIRKENPEKIQSSDMQIFGIKDTIEDKFLDEWYISKIAAEVTELQLNEEHAEAWINKEDNVMEKNERLEKGLPLEFPAVYMKTVAETRAEGEVELYRESNKLNNDCVNAINEAITNNTTYGETMGGRHVDSQKAFEETWEKYGAERVCVVIAAYINHYDYDGRINSRNKEWAKEITLPFSLQNNCPDLKPHQTIMDSFTNKVREVYTKAKEVYNSLDDEANKDMADFFKESHEFDDIYKIMDGELDFKINFTPYHQEKINQENSIPIISEKTSDFGNKEEPQINKEEKVMSKISAVAFEKSNPESKVTNVLVTLNDSLSFKVKAIDGVDAEGNAKTYIDMPSRPLQAPASKERAEKDPLLQEGDRFKPVFVPTKGSHEAIKEVVLEALKNPVAATKDGEERDKPALNPEPLTIKTFDYRLNDNPQSKTMATFSATISNGDVGVYCPDMRLIEGEKGAFISMPQLQGTDLVYRDQVYPITAEAQIAIKGAAIEGYSRQVEYDATMAEITANNQKPAQYSIPAGEAANKIVEVLREADMPVVTSQRVGSALLSIQSTQVGIDMAKGMIKQLNTPEVTTKVNGELNGKISPNDVKEAISNANKELEPAQKENPNPNQDDPDR
ncbi:MAG: DUF3849 domain-containing protein [Oscillospiraceae bacterium]|nr:DUF3849 domain-containing protein [Oscillospiraceae bacterium]